jgi:sugar O-acyltransferase (sialic acid O-acetyltransferase NeuD family)
MIDASRSLVVVGGGGHAKVVVSTLQQAGYSVLRVLDDDNSRWGSKILGIPITGPISAVKEEDKALIAIGNNSTRQRIVESLQLEWQTVVHPTAYVHPSVKLGVGTVVFAGAVIQPETTIGNHVIVNTGATIDHDCIIGDYVHVAPGCHLAGNVRLGEGTILGIGSAVIPNIRIGSWAIVGAGGIVIEDLPDRIVAVGVPARKKRQD